MRQIGYTDFLFLYDYNNFLQWKVRFSTLFDILKKIDIQNYFINYYDFKFKLY